MSIPAAVQGALRPGRTITWLRDQSNIAEDLTGATITGVLRHARTGVTRAITGTLAVTDGPGGVFTWDFSAADVAQAGLHYAQFSASYGSGVTPARTFRCDFLVEEYG